MGRADVWEDGAEMARLLPLRVRRAIRGMRSSRVAGIADALEALVDPRVRRGILPPSSLRGYVGAAASFEDVGAEFAGYLRDLAGLAAHETLLDYGCGVGRMALPLTLWLRGSYLGMDVDPRCIDWCRHHITPTHPNFRFIRLDIRNARYNPRGRVEPLDVRLPLETVDVAVAASVFTHLRRADTVHLLGELGRVATRGLISAYVLDTEDPRLPVRDGPARYANAVVPEEMVGYQRDWFEGALRAAGFDSIVCLSGRWRGGHGPTEQDLFVVARGEAAHAAPALDRMRRSAGATDEGFSPPEGPEPA